MATLCCQRSPQGVELTLDRELWQPENNEHCIMELNRDLIKNFIKEMIFKLIFRMQQFTKDDTVRRTVTGH